MSYPLIVQPLIIEDEVAIKEAYERIFQNVARDFPCALARPCFAFSYEDAIDLLGRDTIFHVVVLDLRLPEKSGLPARENIDLGLSLLARCVERDSYPIPALLVISGQIDQAEQARMQDALYRDFYYGRPLVKGPHLANLEEEIHRACKEAMRYCGVGIHLRDAGEKQFPTISPRDEDLLRRSVLQQVGGVGLDLMWWSATRMQEVMRAASPWTKVLSGRYLLDGGVETSRPRFFKLFPGPDAQSVIHSVKSVELKLSHIKITSTVTARSTALIVTEKVGHHGTNPKSLGDFFQHGTPEQATNIANQISKQVKELGVLLPEHRSVKGIFAKSHCEDVLTQQWSSFAGKESQERISFCVNPIGLYAEWVKNERKVYLKERSLVHGDLHVHNVAVDWHAGGPEAYIFDPGLITRNIAGRDLAVLEVSTLLHQRIDLESFSAICTFLYSLSDSRCEEKLEGMPKNFAQFAKTVISFVRGLREAALGCNSLYVYSLMIFDSVLMQVGGLALDSSGNKISEPRNAFYLLVAVAEWVQRIQKSEYAIRGGEDG